MYLKTHPDPIVYSNPYVHSNEEKQIKCKGNKHQYVETKIQDKNNENLIYSIWTCSCGKTLK